MILHVESVRYLGDFRLRVAFSDGITKDVDLEGELYGEIFEPLRDLDVFRQVRVNPESRTVEWPNGADFAPEFLYEVGKTVERVV
jgi:hypothetical protein